MTPYGGSFEYRATGLSTVKVGPSPVEARESLEPTLTRVQVLVERCWNSTHAVLSFRGRVFGALSLTFGLLTVLLLLYFTPAVYFPQNATPAALTLAFAVGLAVFGLVLLVFPKALRRAALWWRAWRVRKRLSGLSGEAAKLILVSVRIQELTKLGDELDTEMELAPLIWALLIALTALILGNLLSGVLSLEGLWRALCVYSCLFAGIVIAIRTYFVARRSAQQYSGLRDEILNLRRELKKLESDFVMIPIVRE